MSKLGLRAVAFWCGLACLGGSGCAGSQAAAGKPAHPQPLTADPKPSLRLPTTVQPLSYSLELSILPKTERFSGRTQIQVELREPRQVIWLHGQGLHVTEVSAEVAGQRVLGRYQQQDGDGLASLTFDAALPAGKALLSFQYDAPFNQQLQGLYRVVSADESYAFTQFESVSARLAFPCFDEPSFKTPYDVWLTVAAGDVALSNSQVVAEERAGEYKRVHFAQTKPLPTYLVAFAVGPLDVVEAQPLPPSDLRKDAIPLRGVAPKGRGASIGPALATVAPVLSALERYFGIAYPYDKLDIVAVPDFAAGAMENAGLVTFRDSLLLLDPQSAGEGQRRASLFVLAHELAHQWFGDLVTMRFWEDIWLNEAFATFFEYRIADQLHPEYKGELELLEDVQEAMSSDSRVTARMIRQPIETTHDIINAFDSITYSKGGGVIRMFERYLGPEAFQRGIQAFLREHAFGNADTSDLLRALSAAAGRDVTLAWNSFLTQAGVPLVATKLVCEPGKPAQLSLSQSRYLPLGSEGTAKQLWKIPVCARYEAGGSVRESCTLLEREQGSLPLEAAGCPAWIMPNADGAGYYRFTLDPDALQKLRDVGLPKLSARERYALLQALIAGFQVDTVKASDLLAALPKFAADEERLVASLPGSFVDGLRERWLARPELSPEQRKTFLTKLQSYVRGMYKKTADRLGLREQKGESGEAKLLRARVVSTLAMAANDAPTRVALARAGRQYLGLDAGGKLHPEVLPTELLDLGLRMLVEDGDADVWNAVYARVRTEQDAIERSRLIVALASVRDKARSERARALVLDPVLRVNEALLPIRVQLGDFRTRADTYAYFEQNFDGIAQRVSPSTMGGTPWFAEGLCDQAQATRVEQFFTPRIEKLPGGPRSLDGVLEQLQLCDALIKVQAPALSAYFSKL